MSQEIRYYTPERDGDLEEYVDSHGFLSKTKCYPLFKGHEPYELLKKEGYLWPNVSIIRMIWPEENRAEKYLVTEDYTLLGISQNPLEGGRKGSHSSEDILSESNTLWEARALLSKARRVRMMKERLEGEEGRKSRFDEMMERARSGRGKRLKDMEKDFDDRGLSGLGGFEEGE